MAQLSPTMEEGRLLEWKVEEGDQVAQGDVVAEIETDKANMEVEALGSGVLRKILVEEGATVPVGTLIGIIAEEDEEIEELLAEASTAETTAETEEETEEETEVAPASGEERGEATTAEPEAEKPASAVASAEREREAPLGETAAEDGRIKASPVARKIAEERGLDLRRITGSGPGGRIVKADVEAAEAPEAAEEEVRAEPPAEEERAAPRAPAGPPRLEDRVEEASQMRKAIARRLADSIGPVPHFFLTTEIDMGRALDLRAELNDRWEEGKIGVNDLLLKTAAEALVRHPAVNASWADDAIHYHGRVDLGIAVAVDGGLITPVLRGAEAKGLREISAEAAALIERARNRKLTPEEYEGATFSVSNLGMFDIEHFTAVINPPEAAILAVGKTEERPVAVEGEVVIRRRMRVTMSCDHRVVDGATGAGFLATFKAMLENPLEMIL